ncbi:MULTISPECIES: RNase adapter RapZ [unclassified Clostridioides]|uniref:RNase adapter RapZ n=1 Tax=unclassified Clostridioides TaxID=2635829 RepID=UPI001D12B7F9|nr:RNase adapter RapZ [Clostridioides sp. ZZV15-6388]MCC0646223.1 RNase adapter RapZ [Clostridioides sp. ZZV14-6150]MCC0660713.1 RNase adapter RapZ [Clostridioides sp. ZZV14-6154]MCC0665449.1 RNase adapter RapZ [Clostridioides sp. ZZV15-6597]MCC0669779.1 RNase adapter RapZ [Clostridioides sp. ZZV14-6153]MCC0720061.1 RNase adapter RapZ [Clostridioides sp. ZZV14-6105]MCC0724208.1 RNase adapter RapZ [Clostridioides sp. ZZV14-6104]MCC0727733.1 RNase adapter RapZ [Clostridioides sp. ZZV14-6045]M
MKFVIVTGLSGSGKSETMRALEDMGFYCVDNLPPALITKFAELCYQPNSSIDKVALGIDIRGRKFFEALHESLNYLEKENYEYEMVYLDCNDDVLLKRYKMTRRNHPLAKDMQIPEGIKMERKIMEPLKGFSTCIIDTTNMKPKDLKEEIKKIYSSGEENPNLTISVVSFGFKHGILADADLVFDVRFLPNPYYIEELRSKTGDDKEVRDYVMNSKISEEFYVKLLDMIHFLVPQYIEEGKQHLVIGVGCTGGRHRSVTITNLIAEDLSNKGYRVVKKHRDSMLR